MTRPGILLDDVVIEDLRPDEYVCQRCHLIHLKAAGDSACDEV